VDQGKETMKRILICAADHYGYPEFVARGFRQLGLDARWFRHRRAKIAPQWTEAASPFKRIRRALILRAINRRLLAVARRWRPDIVLWLNPSAMWAETLAQLNRISHTVLWAEESLASILVPQSHWDLFRTVAVFEPADCLTLPKAHYLPYGYDPDVYHPLNLPAQYDVLFVGSAHASRIDVLDRVARCCGEWRLRFAVAGPSYRQEVARRGRVLARDYPALAAAVVHHGEVGHAAINRLYNQSRIILNLHHPQSRMGVNPRVFEILATGRMQVVDAHERLATLFAPNRDLTVYRSDEELLDHLHHFCTHEAERECIAASGRSRLLQDGHTFQDRCRQLLVWTGD
jgi:spore maturation protein CgeB